MPKVVSQPRRTLVSAFILGALILQAAAGSGMTTRVLGLSRQSTWPFIDYALFREAHRPGETIDTWLVRATTQSGDVVELSPLGVDWVMGVKVHDLTDALADRSPQRVRYWRDTYGRVSGDPLVEIELFETRYRLERDGFTSENRGSIGSLILEPLPPVDEWPLGPSGRVR